MPKSLCCLKKFPLFSLFIFLVVFEKICQSAPNDEEKQQPYYSIYRHSSGKCYVQIRNAQNWSQIFRYQEPSGKEHLMFAKMMTEPNMFTVMLLEPKLIKQLEHKECQRHPESVKNIDTIGYPKMADLDTDLALGRIFKCPANRLACETEQFFQVQLDEKGKKGVNIAQIVFSSQDEKHGQVEHISQSRAMKSQMAYIFPNVCPCGLARNMFAAYNSDEGVRLSKRGPQPEIIHVFLPTLSKCVMYAGYFEKMGEVGNIFEAAIEENQQQNGEDEESAESLLRPIMEYSTDSRLYFDALPVADFLEFWPYKIHNYFFEYGNDDDPTEHFLSEIKAQLKQFLTLERDGKQIQQVEASDFAVIKSRKTGKNAIKLVYLTLSKPEEKAPKPNKEVKKILTPEEKLNLLTKKLRSNLEHIKMETEEHFVRMHNNLFSDVIHEMIIKKACSKELGGPYGWKSNFSELLISSSPGYSNMDMCLCMFMDNLGSPENATGWTRLPAVERGQSALKLLFATAEKEGKSDNLKAVLSTIVINGNTVFDINLLAKSIEEAIKERKWLKTVENGEENSPENVEDRKKLYLLIGLMVNAVAKKRDADLKKGLINGCEKWQERVKKFQKEILKGYYEAVKHKLEDHKFKPSDLIRAHYLNFAANEAEDLLDETKAFGMNLFSRLQAIETGVVDKAMPKASIWRGILNISTSRGDQTETDPSARAILELAKDGKLREQMFKLLRRCVNSLELQGQSRQVISTKLEEEKLEWIRKWSEANPFYLSANGD